FCNFTNKGSLVCIDGLIQTRSYDNKDRQRVYVTEVIVDNFSLLESRKEREARSQNSGYAPQNNGSSYAGNSTQNTNFQPNNRAPNTNNAAP
ncbi:single-stranded DNA-binding protein, partial [Lactobacillus jensenii]|uniref:single-stranded DNA-binding protein n=1 Tax=Lactobacillus jensenii TaxID=109790 RepID=UPI00286FDFD7